MLFSGTAPRSSSLVLYFVKKKGTGKAWNSDVQFSRWEKMQGICQKYSKCFFTGHLSPTLEIKGYARIVMGYNLNHHLLTLK